MNACRVVVGMLAVLLVAGQVGADKAKPKPPAQVNKFKFLKIVKDGQELPKKDLKDMVLIIKGKVGTVKKGNEVLMVKTNTKMEGPNKKFPLWKIDIKITKGEGKGKTLKGIMALKEDGTTEICWGKPGGKRPKKFVSKKGTGHVYELLEPVEAKKEKE
jgi:uncharacterized protein (TIGR03067 family)